MPSEGFASIFRRDLDRLPALRDEELLPKPGKARPRRWQRLGVVTVVGVIALVGLEVRATRGDPFAGTAAPAVDAAARAECVKSSYAIGRTLVAAFRSTAAEVASWQENRRPGGSAGPTSHWRSVPGTQIVDACYFEGSFSKGPPPPVSGTAAPSFNRIVVLVSQGADELAAAGYQDQIEPVAPH